MSNIYFFLLSFIISVSLMPLLKTISIKYRLYDEPGQDRLKIHATPISYLGGVGIFAAFVLIIITGILLQKLPSALGSGIMICGIIVITLGLMDDWKWKKSKPRPLLKLLWQMISTLAVVYILILSGIAFDFSSSLVLGAFIASFYIVGAMNSMNMEDGMDGLAGGLSVISLAGFAIVFSAIQGPAPVFLPLVLAGAILGFLIYNWNPATIFMGDSGSHFLGFSMALFAIMVSSDPFENPARFIGPILIIGLPIVDTIFAIARRAVNGKSIFMGDRSHLYDTVHGWGFGIRPTVLICYMTQIIIVLGGILIFQF